MCIAQAKCDIIFCHVTRHYKVIEVLLESCCVPGAESWKVYTSL